MGLLGDDHLYLCDEDVRSGLYLRQLDTEAAARGALIIMNPPSDAQHYAYVRQYPEVAVSCINDGAYSDDDLLAAFQAGTLEAYLISSYSVPLERLAKKGYISPITDPAILAVAEQMDDGLLAACKVDGQLYALPITGFITAYLYNRYNAEMLGFTSDTLPKTFPEVIRLLADWEDRFWNEFPDYIPFWDNYLKSSLYRTVYRNYCAYIAREGQPMHFDTPLFRKLLETMASVDLDAVAHDLGMDDDGIWEKFSLLNDMSGFEIIDSREPVAILPLALDDGLLPVIPVELRVMMINARSTRQKEATDYLRCVAENYPYDSERRDFFPPAKR